MNFDLFQLKCTLLNLHILHLSEHLINSKFPLSFNLFLLHFLVNLLFGELFISIENLSEHSGYLAFLQRKHIDLSSQIGIEFLLRTGIKLTNRTFFYLFLDSEVFNEIVSLHHLVLNQQFSVDLLFRTLELSSKSPDFFLLMSDNHFFIIINDLT